MTRPKLTLLKGGLQDKTPGTTPGVSSSQNYWDNSESEVNLKYGNLIARAIYYNKEKEISEIQNLIYSYEARKLIKSQLLVCLSNYDYLLSLPCPPFRFICNLKEELFLYSLGKKK